MKEESDAQKKMVKTYISESNQNKITHTLEVERQPQSSAEVEQEKQNQADAATYGPDSQAHDTSAPEEPELLNAPTETWPPTTAAADAAAVAGLPQESIPGQEGDVVAPASGEENRQE